MAVIGHYDVGKQMIILTFSTSHDVRDQKRDIRLSENRLPDTLIEDVVDPLTDPLLVTQLGRSPDGHVDAILLTPLEALDLFSHLLSHSRRQRIL